MRNYGKCLIRHPDTLPVGKLKNLREDGKKRPLKTKRQLFKDELKEPKTSAADSCRFKLELLLCFSNIFEAMVRLIKHSVFSPIAVKKLKIAKKIGLFGAENAEEFEKDTSVWHRVNFYLNSDDTIRAFWKNGTQFSKTNTKKWANQTAANFGGPIRYDGLKCIFKFP